MTEQLCRRLVGADLRSETKHSVVCCSDHVLDGQLVDFNWLRLYFFCHLQVDTGHVAWNLDLRLKYDCVVASVKNRVKAHCFQVRDASCFVKV